MRQISYEKSTVMSAVAFDMVRDVVMAKRREGQKAAFAIPEAANDLGVSSRWVVSVLRNEPCAAKPKKFARILARYQAWLEADIARSEAILEQRRQKLAEMGGAHAAPDMANGLVAGSARVVVDDDGLGGEQRR